LHNHRFLGVVAQMKLHHLLVASHLCVYGYTQRGQWCSVNALASHQYSSQHHGASHNTTDHISTSSRSVKVLRASTPPWIGAPRALFYTQQRRDGSSSSRIVDDIRHNYLRIRHRLE